MNDLARRSLLGAMVALGAFAAQPAAAQGSGADASNRQIRLIVPYAPGGTSDILARLLAGPMQATLGQSVIVENRAGAGSLLGTDLVVRAPPDGTTLLLADTPLTTVPSMHVGAGRPAPYDPVTSLTPIVHLAATPAVMFTAASLPARTVQEFFALARARPDTMSIASSGVGSTTHLIAELVIRQSGARMAHVPYRGGGPALQDVAAGNVQATFIGWASGASLVQGGQLHAMGVAAERRMTSLPQVPTLREQGLDIVATFWWGLLGPANLPAPIQQRLAQAATAAMASPEVATRLAALSVEQDIRDGEAFRAHIRAEHERWGGVIRAAGLRAE